MGIINQGVYGGLSGKTGNLIGASWKGIPYLRIKPASVHNPNTLAQQIQRLKFALTVFFLQPLQSFVNVGFKGYATKMSPLNAAMSYNIQNAITGVFPDFAINYPNVLLSRGQLTAAQNPTAESVEAGKIRFSWEENSNEGKALATDKVMVVAYFPETKEAFSNLDGAARIDCVQEIVVPARLSGSAAETWIAFKNADGSLVSVSQYVDNVTVM